MSADMSLGNANLESQLLSILDVLVKAAVAEISHLFSENSASLCIQLTQSLKENEALRARMGSMRSELFCLRLQTRNNRPASRFSQLRRNLHKPRSKPKVSVKLPASENAVMEAASGPVQLKNETYANQTRQQGDVDTAEVILIKDEDDVEEYGAVTGQKHIGHKSKQDDGEGTGSLDLRSSCTADAGDELRILSVHGRGEGPLQDMDDGLFTASELEDFSPLSPDHSVTHDCLLNFPQGAADRVPMTGSQQDTGVELVGNSQLDNRSTQMAPAIVEMPFVGTDSMMRYRSDVSHFPQQPNIFVPRIPQSSEDPTEHKRKKLICSHCGKSFFRKNSLTIHLRIHTGEKPYACTQCGKRFTQTGGLKIHLRTHSGEKPYTCKQCSSSFNNLSNLRRHMVTHTTFDI